MTTIHDMHMSEVGSWPDGDIQDFIDLMEAESLVAQWGCPLDVAQALIALRK